MDGTISCSRNAVVWGTCWIIPAKSMSLCALASKCMKESIVPSQDRQAVFPTEPAVVVDIYVDCTWTFWSPNWWIGLRVWQLKICCFLQVKRPGAVYKLKTRCFLSAWETDLYKPTVEVEVEAVLLCLWSARWKSPSLDGLTCEIAQTMARNWN